MQPRSQTPRQQMESEIVEKARADKSFRELLISNPKAALAQEFSIEIPEQVAVTVLCESPAKLYMVLPFDPGADLENLAPEELALLSAVGGGM